MLSVEYTELRLMAAEQNRKLGEDHPCSKGKAKCCKSNVPLLPEDEETIVEAIKRGYLNNDTMKMVLERAERAKKNNNICPLLSGGNLCLVHGDDIEPLICLITGNVGTAKDSKIAKALVQLRPPQVSYKLLYTSMCPDCHNQLVRQGATIPFEDINKLAALIGYQKIVGSRSVTNFVLSEFPKLL